ncbi:MAG: insulinase family protein, partial [bacterium]|nr:insulinase family protein [bacterium]
GHEETLFAIATDPKASRTSVSIYYKQPVREEGTEAAYRQSLVESLYNGMLNARLSELTKKPDAPFLYGNSGQGRFIRTKEFYYLGGGVKEDGILRGLEALLTEGARVQQHGFTQTELEREKVEMLRGMERTYEERDKLQSRGFASEYIRHYLTGEPIPGIEYEYGLYQKLLPGIQLEEVNRLAGEWITDHDRVILLDGPEKEGVEMPTEEALAEAIARVAQVQVAAYEDRVSDQPLVETLPQAAEIVQETQVSELGVTEWALGNGVKVVLKPTDFKNDQVLFSAFSPGGHSLVSDKDYVSATSAVSVLRESGVGAFDLVALQKKLAGKAVGVSPWIGDLQEGMNGSASPKDLETLFQLIYLSFTAPRKDTTAFLAYKERMLGMLKNRSADPRAAFGDTLQVTLAQHHYRARPWSEALLEEMDLDRSLEVYRDRFADASDFIFVFVGNLDTAQVKPLVKTYLGGLPALHRNETWKDVGVRPPEGVLEKIVRKGLEPKSNTRIVFTGPFEWTRQNRYDLDAMTQVLGIKLREVMREDMGGTYGVGVWESTSRYPREGYSINVSFGCSPERVNELMEAVFAQVDSLKRVGTTDVYLNKVKESQRRGREVAMKENGFWRGALESVYEHGQDPLTILTYNELVEGLTLEAVQKAAQKYFDMRNYVRVVLYPETMEGREE